MDAHTRKVENCYKYYEYLSNVIEKSDYTDGMYFGIRNTPYEQAQTNQIQYLLDEAKITSGMTILDIGCGRGRLLQEAKNRGAQATGITISPEQVKYCTERGLDVRLLDYKKIGAEWYGKFDAVIANGSIEHFVSVNDGLNRKANEIYRQMFVLVHRMMKPDSASRRFVTTAIHHRYRYGEKFAVSFKNKAMFSLLDRVYGGWYPLTGQLEHCAGPLFHAAKVVDGTQDYLWTSQDAFKGWFGKLFFSGTSASKVRGEFLKFLFKAGLKSTLF